MNGIPRQSKGTVEDTKFGAMEVSMKVTGRVTKQMAEEDLFMLMVTYMTVTGKMIRHMVSGNIPTLMERNMKVIGLMINNTGKEKNTGLMEPNMKVNTSSERKMVTDNFYGQIAQATVVSSLITTSMEKVLTLGPMVEFTTEIGSKTKCMVEEYLLGRMDASTRENTLMIRNRDMESFIGQMEDSMMDTGCQASKKVLVSISMQKEKYVTVDGKMVNVSNGYLRRNIIRKYIKCIRETYLRAQKG